MSYESSRNITMETIKEGDNINFPKKGQTVVVHYEGTLLNGQMFDSSRKPGQVIKGWDIAVAQMSKGQVAKVTIPYELAYGERGIGNIIPAKSDLIFTIELIDFY